MGTIDFDIPVHEVLRYAGHRGKQVPDSLESIAVRVAAECKKHITPRSIVRRYPVEQDEQGIKIKGTDIILKGSDIKKHLAGCDECCIVCATAGAGADAFIRTMLALDTVHGMFADAAATAAVENLCDNIEKELREQMGREGKYLTWRYSPGYGDFPFTQQPDILSLLQTEKFIGVTCNESCIMLPSKSVTAVMGIATEKPQGRKYKCEDCPNRENCNFSCR